MKFTFIVCGNGYGHLRRVCSVVEELCKQRANIDVLILGASHHPKMLSTWGYDTIFSKLGIRFENVNTEKLLGAILPESFSFELYHSTWKSIVERIEMFSSDIIVSDNLVGILQYYPRAIIMGSFLWPDVLKDKYQDWKELITLLNNEYCLLENNKPLMLGVEDMGMDSARRYTQFVGLPWFCKRKLHETSHTNTDILFTAGGTNNALKEIIKLLESIDFNEVNRIFVDNNLYSNLNDTLRRKVSLFDFTPQSFLDLKLIVCRPGIGILTESIEYGVPVLVFPENDKEIMFNCRRVEQLNIGKVYQEISSFSEMIHSDLSQYKNNSIKRPDNGAAMAAQYIIKHIAII